MEHVVTPCSLSVSNRGKWGVSHLLPDLFRQKPFEAYLTDGPNSGLKPVHMFL